MLKWLKILSMDQSRIITGQDKVNGAVLLKKTDYIEKMEHLLQDYSKFRKVETDLLKAVMKYEDRNIWLT